MWQQLNVTSITNWKNVQECRGEVYELQVQRWNVYNIPEEHVSPSSHHTRACLSTPALALDLENTWDSREKGPRIFLVLSRNETKFRTVHLFD